MKQGWLKSAHLYACWFSAPVVNVGGAGKHRLTLKLQEIKRNYQGFLLCCHNMETWSTHELWKEKTLPQYIGNLYIYPVTSPSMGTIFHIHPENYTLRMLHTYSINWNRMWYTLSLILATLRCKRRGIFVCGGRFSIQGFSVTPWLSCNSLETRLPSNLEIYLPLLSKYCD